MIKRKSSSPGAACKAFELPRCLEYALALCHTGIAQLMVIACGIGSPFWPRTPLCPP